jgi:hypothetical protein
MGLGFAKLGIGSTEVSEDNRLFLAKRTQHSYLVMIATHLVMFECSCCNEVIVDSYVYVKC